MSSGGFWLIATNVGLLVLVLVPVLAIGIAILRDAVSRRCARRWSFVDVPGIGRIPVLNDGDRTAASCRKA